MKKIIILILIAFMMPINIKAVGGISTHINGGKTITSLEQFTLTFGFETSSSIMGIQGDLDYDSTKLTLISATGINGFTVTVGSKVVADSIDAKSGSYNFAVLTFKATSNFKVGEMVGVHINNVWASDGINDFMGYSSYTNITMAVPKSTNNNLSNLTINGNTISGFNASKTLYSLTLENNVSSINIGAIAQDSKSTITGTGTKNLNDYLNTFNVVVKAESGATKNYTINIYRKDKEGRTEALQTDNTLSILTVDGYNINFTPVQETYDLEIENIESKLSISATTTSSKANYVVNNIEELKVGINVITIVVTAENGSTKTYTINVTRKGDGVITTLDKLIDVIDKATTKNINVTTTTEQTELTKEMLLKIKDTNKKIIINRYDDKGMLLYTWNFIGSNVGNIDLINTKILFTTENIKNISKLTNYANGVYLNFQNEGQLPKDTQITVYVGNEYENGEELNLYYYDNIKNKLEKVEDNIIVQDNYVTFSISHTSEYFLTRSQVITFNNLWIIIYAQALIIGIFIYNLIYRKYIKKLIQRVIK